MATKPFNTPAYTVIVTPIREEVLEVSESVGFEDKGPATDYAKKLAAEGTAAVIYEAMTMFEAVVKVEATWSRGAG